MAAEVKARITVDAANALKRIEDINKASNYTSASMSKMAKEIGAANAALQTLGGGMGGTASGTAFKNITDQLEKQALAYSLVDTKAKAAAESATLYRNAIISLTKSGSLTKEQTDALVRSYNNYKTAAESAKRSSDAFGKSAGDSGLKLLSVAKNILKFQLLMGPITAAVRGFKNTISDSLNVAAEAEQRFSKLATVFNGISEAARGAATSIASSLGVANSTAASALSTVGDLLQAQGMGTSESLATASEWVRKFQDIIAFKDINMSLEEFAQNFMSGAAGNLRNFRTFGSIVKESAVQARLMAEGLDQLTGSELELEKMTIRAEMALEQQANAMGATKREWETMLSVNRRLSEAWKQYKETLGESLNEAIKPMKSWLADILTLTNRVVSNVKEIQSGEFTVKVKQDTSEDYLNQIYNTFMSSNGKGLSKMTPAERIFEEFLTPGEMRGVYNKSIADSDLNTISGATISQIVDLMKATGATGDQVFSSLVLKNQGTFDDATATAIHMVINSAEGIVKAWESEQTVIDKTRASLEKIADTTDNFTESLGSLAHVDLVGSDLAGFLQNSSFSYDYIDVVKQLMGDKSASAVSGAIASAIASLGTGRLTSNSFANPIDLAFGTNDKGQDFQSWLDEIKELYAILANRQKKFGDVGEDTLQTVINLWGEVNEELQKYLDGIERTKLFNAGITTMQGNATSYDRQFQLVGLEGLALQTKELELDFLDLKESLGELSDDELNDLNIAYNNQIAALTRLYEAQEKYAARLEAQSSGRAMLSGYQGDIERAAFIASHTGKPAILDNQVVNINESQASIWYDLRKATESLAAKLPSLAYTIDEAGQKVYDFGDGMTMTIDEVYAILNNYFIPKIKDAADAAENFWKAIGQRALGATGTLGSVVQAFQGDGDIWSKIVNALLTILENTESWGEIVEVLNQIFAMFEPVTEALVDFLTSLPWDIIIFALKVIATVIVTISKTVEMINAAFNWLWYNIKEAFRSLGEVIAHPIKAANGELSVWNWKTFDEFASEEMEIYDKMVEYLGDIWDTSYKIERNTRVGDDYAKQLALLRGLYNGGVLTDAQYRGEVAKVTGSSLGSIETYSGASYATGNGGVTYFSGNIVINGYNGDPEELALEIERILTKRSMAGANTH